MKPSDALRLLVAVLPKRPVFLEGPPGVSKSAIMRQAARELEKKFGEPFGFIDFRLAQVASEDIRGLPRVDDDGTTWCPPSIFPRSGRGILCLEEMPQAEQDVQKVCMQLMHDRMVGEYSLPPGWCLGATGNGRGDRSGANRLLAALSNRVVRIPVEADPSDWLAWARSSGIHPDIVRFIEWKPEALYGFDPTRDQDAFATPRTWHYLSDILDDVPEDLLLPAVEGTIGKGYAAEFVGEVRLRRSLPDPDFCLKNPTQSAVPTQASVVKTLIDTLCQRVKAAPAHADDYATYCQRLPDEYQVVAIRGLLTINKAFMANKGTQSWMGELMRKGMFKGF
jgi:hypothetical protein